jgi:hypothetical protein
VFGALVDRAIMQRVAQTLGGSGSPVEDDDDQDDLLESVLIQVTP